MPRLPVSDTRGRFASNQVVVDTRDLPLLEEILQSLGVPSGTADGDIIPQLDLTRVTLGDLTAFRGSKEAAAVRTDLELKREEERYPEPPTDLDVLMTLVRRIFKDTTREELRAGKDRDLELVEGLPHWAGFDRPLPHWASAGEPQPAEPPALVSRDTEPGRRVRVGVLDTGMFPNADLDGRYLSSDLFKPNPPAETWAGHAVFIVGLIAQEAPSAVIEVRRVLDDDTGLSTAWDLAKSMASFLGTGVEILNISLGCFTIDDNAPFLLERAAQRLAEEMLVVAAAGNHGAGQKPAAVVENGKPEWLPDPISTSSPMWPAALPDVVAVGAARVETCEEGVRMTRAAFTPKAQWIKLWADGVDVRSYYLDGEVVSSEWENVKGLPVEKPVDVGVFKGFAQWSGTSFAAAIVTGRLAFLAQTEGWSVGEAYRQVGDGQRNGDCGPYDIRPGVNEPAAAQGT